MLNSYDKRRLHIIRDYCIAWTLAFAFFSLIRGWGTIEQGSLKLDLISSIKITLTLGPIMGIFSGINHWWMIEKVYKKISVLKFLLLRLIYSLLFIILLMFIAFILYQFYFSAALDIKAFIFQQGSFAIYFYVLSVDLLINIISQFNMMLGNGNLSKLLMGKFYYPREEQRVFMFLDLQSSTSLAEKLGHQLYSAFIQDCFNDLSVVVEDYAEIHQYIGDEAVLTWELSKGIHPDHYIKAFFRFKDQINSRQVYYQTQYGAQPFFKAGIHAGKVMVAEIGKYKREIAYHGDAVNTAARIQGLCNTLKAELLISETVKTHLKSDFYFLKNVGSTILKGKQEAVAIYSVQAKRRINE